MDNFVLFGVKKTKPNKANIMVHGSWFRVQRVMLSKAKHQGLEPTKEILHCAMLRSE